MKKAFGYIKVRKDRVNSQLNQLVVEGIKEICKQNNWELVQIYQDKVTRRSSPKKESRKLFTDMNVNNSVDVTIIFCFGEYVIYGPNEIDFVLMEDLEIADKVEKELFILSLKNA